MKFYRTILNSILTNLTPSEQKKGIWIIVLMVFNALLDFFSIAVFLPLMATIIDPSFSANNSVAKKFHLFFGSTSHATLVITTASLVLLFILIKNSISLWIADAKIRYAFNLRNNLASRTLIDYIQNSFIEFTKTDFTRELNKITSHPLAFANNIILSLATIVSEACVGIFILACIVFYDYKVVLLVILILLPMFIIFHLRKKSMKKISNEIKTTYPVLLKYSNQMIEGYVDINSYQKFPFFYQRFQQISKKLTETFIKDQTLQAGTLRLTEIVIALVMCSLVIYSVVANLHYQQTLVLLGIYAGASFRIVPSVNRILHALQQIRTNEHILEEFKTPLHKTLITLENRKSNVVFTETISLKKISFRYPDGPQALDQISLTIRKGNKIAITGGSGEGKTTFLLVLLGLLQQTEGELLVDNTPIDDKSTWLKLISYVPQNPYILDGTVAENIAFGIPTENIDRTKIFELITSLDLNNLIQHLPNGIDSRIGERGAKLSGGQRQRLAIARALYADTEILILDEITNQVHGIMELEIMSLLNNLADKKKTIIMVTHKIVQPSFFDAIFELEKGSLRKIDSK